MRPDIQAYFMSLANLRPDEFQQHIDQGTLRLAFIGMSNCGKSYRSRILAKENDFFHYEVDLAIQKILGFSDMGEISDWLGYPTSEEYANRAVQYLEAEEKSTHLAHLDTGDKNLVFDTTGSVIYLTEDTQRWLKDECLIVNIDVGNDSIEELSDHYFSEPKPVIWGEMFNQAPGEEAMSAMRRCYPKMLAERIGKYRELAHLSIPHSHLFDTTGEETLQVIKNNLSNP